MENKGYQGIQTIHENSQISKKKSREAKLSYEDKNSNQELAKIRILGEHVNRKLKVFKILSLTYRNRRKRFSLKFNLIAVLYNYELHLPQTKSSWPTFARGLLTTGTVADVPPEPTTRRRGQSANS